MPRLLTPEQVDAFHRDGFVSPITVLTPDEARACRERLEDYERSLGHPIQSNMRHNVHLLFTWANELVRNPRVLDAMEDVLGPNLRCWVTNFFIKEANDPAFVSWHQDSTYWGLEPHDVVTAWVALSDVPPESGPMKMVPGSHRWEQLPHVDTFDENNLLSRGQEVQVEVADEDGVDLPMRAGEMSLHHVRTVHGSGPNRNDDRRIALAIRYIPTHVRQVKVRDAGMLVRGTDEYGYFDEAPQPQADVDAAAVAAHEAAAERLLAALMDGTEATEFRA